MDNVLSIKSKLRVFVFNLQVSAVRDKRRIEFTRSEAQENEAKEAGNERDAGKDI